MQIKPNRIHTFEFASFAHVAKIATFGRYTKFVRSKRLPKCIIDIVLTESHIYLNKSRKSSGDAETYVE